MCDADSNSTEFSFIFCRICHDSTGELLKICKCEGSIGLVHKKCQEKWMSVSNSNNCNLCGFKFKFTMIRPHWTEVSNSLCSKINY